MRISVIGTSGAGKTTFARRLAEAVGAPYVELDAINWQRRVRAELSYRSSRPPPG